MEGQDRPFAVAGHARFHAALPLRENGTTRAEALAGMDRRSLGPGLERHGAVRQGYRHAGAAAGYRADRAGMRAWLRRLPVCGLRLAQGLSEPRCLPREDAEPAVDENFGAAAGLSVRELPCVPESASAISRFIASSSR